jgi:MFS family permease
MSGSGDSGDDRATPERGGLPRDIWALGFVSLLMDVSSEMIHGLLPVFLTTVLGASVTLVGAIEGIGESTAAIAKLFSGWLSDRLRKRKALAVVGYTMGALSKPFFALAPTASWVLAARFADRIGKGVRGAPRDALVADLVPARLRGAAYGLRQSLDTVGAFAGPLLALALMSLLDDDFRLVFWIAVIPGLAAVGVLVLGVRDAAPAPAPMSARTPIGWRDLARVGGHFWSVVAVSAVLTLARFSEAFLILRAENVGLPIALTPLVLVVMNAVYAGSAYPMGRLSDRLPRRPMIAAGFLVLLIADVVLALAADVWMVMLGIGLWGLHMGMTQGVLAALVAGAVPGNLRGSAFGVFHLASGIALLLASVIAGLLWQSLGPHATFAAGAAFTAVGLAGTPLLVRAENGHP